MTPNNPGPILPGLILAAALLACNGDPVTTSATQGSDGSSSSSTSEETATTSTSNPETSTSEGTTGTASATGDTTTTTTDTTTTTTTGETTTTTTTTTGTTDDTTGVDPTGGDHDGFYVGVDVTDVSPTASELDGNNIYMGAYGAPFTRGPAQGVHDAIFTRSFAISVADAGVIMTVVDLPGMGNKVIRAVRKKVADATGLGELQVMIGTTHTHSAPDFQGLWGGVPSGYRNSVADRIAASMIAAWEGRQPAELRVATGKGPNRNRRGWGFTDDDMTVLDALDLEGNRIGTLVDFAAHPVILGEDNKEVSCDFPGPMVLALEAEVAAPVAFFNGTLGDASPDVPDGDYIDDFDRAQTYGELLATIAGDLVESAEVVDVGLVADDRTWEQMIENTLFNAAALLGILQYDFENVGLLDKKVTTQAAYFRLGTKVQVVAFPGESLTRNGLAIKEAMKAPHKIVLGNTGDALGYFIPSDEWQTGKNDNYEETVSLAKDAGDTARDQIVEMIDADPF